MYFKKFLQTHNATFLNLIRYRILITQNHRELGGPFMAGHTVYTVLPKQTILINTFNEKTNEKPLNL